MHAIRKVRQYLEAHPGSTSARRLAKLTTALADESDISFAELYALEMDAFDLAIELMRDWRLDRYYAARLKLYDIAFKQLSEVHR